MPNTVEHPAASRFTNLDYLIRVTKNNPRLMLEMLEAYLEQTPPLVAAMTQSMRVENWEQVYAATHKLIPSFSIVGISAEYEDLARKLQEYAGTRQQTNEIPGLVVQIENICTQACTELDEELNRIKKL